MTDIPMNGIPMKGMPMIGPPATSAQRETSLDVEWLPEEVAARVDADIGTIGEYLAFDVPMARLDVIERRLASDRQFRANALPLIHVCALPVRFGDILKTWKPGDPLPDRHSKDACKAEWRRFMKSAPLFSPFALVRGVIRPSWRRVVLVFAVLFGLIAAGTAFVARSINNAWATGTVDNRAGRALPPGAGLLKPTIYETGPREDRVVTMDRADVTLHQNSRLALGKAGIPGSVGAIDGTAEIVVHKGKVFAVRQGEVLFVLVRGRYRVFHPEGGASRILVDTGVVSLGLFRNKTHYFMGTEIRASARGDTTTVTAVARDGTDLPTKTMHNLMAAPR